MPYCLHAALGNGVCVTNIPNRLLWRLIKPSRATLRWVTPLSFRYTIHIQLAFFLRLHIRHRYVQFA